MYIIIYIIKMQWLDSYTHTKVKGVEMFFNLFQVELLLILYTVLWYPH